MHKSEGVLGTLPNTDSSWVRPSCSPQRWGRGTLASSQVTLGGKKVSSRNRASSHWSTGRCLQQGGAASWRRAWTTTCPGLKPGCPAAVAPADTGSPPEVGFLAQMVVNDYKVAHEDAEEDARHEGEWSDDQEGDVVPGRQCDLLALPEGLISEGHDRILVHLLRDSAEE